MSSDQTMKNSNTIDIHSEPSPRSFQPKKRWKNPTVQRISLDLTLAGSGSIKDLGGFQFLQ
jgi:hypothetical protein